MTKRSNVKFCVKQALIARAQRNDKLCISDAKFPIAFKQFLKEFTHLHVKQEGKTSVESESCIKSIVALRMVYLKVSNFAFDVWQINVRRVKINHLLFIAKDLTMCIKLRNCDILYQFHL